MWFLSHCPSVSLKTGPVCFDAIDGFYIHLKSYFVPPLNDNAMAGEGHFRSLRFLGRGTRARSIRWSQHLPFCQCVTVAQSRQEEVSDRRAAVAVARFEQIVSIRCKESAIHHRRLFHWIRWFFSFFKNHHTTFPEVSDSEYRPSFVDVWTSFQAKYWAISLAFGSCRRVLFEHHSECFRQDNCRCTSGLAVSFSFG